MTASPTSSVAAPVRRLEAADLPWATELLASASLDHPAVRYVCGSRSSPACQQWLLGLLVGYAVRGGGAYANAAGTALALWLSPGRHPGWAQVLRWLPALAWQLGWRGSRRLWHLWRTQSWLRARSLDGPHHLLLLLAVHPAARGRGEGRRLLTATLALRRASGLPCYFGTQLPAQMPFYQRHGFVLAGHCPVGTEPDSPLSTWGLLRPVTD